MKYYLDKFKTSILKHNYYEAHEDLEEWWFPKRMQKSDEVLFVKGLINCAVSFELHKRGKLDGAKRVWKNYLKYKNLIEKLDVDYLDEYKKAIIFLEDIARKKGIE